MHQKKKQPIGQNTLTPAVFYLLLALSGEELHGYELMKKVTIDSGGAMEMGPGTLYGSIKRSRASPGRSPSYWTAARTRRSSRAASSRTAFWLPTTTTVTTCPSPARSRKYATSTAE